MDTEGTGACCHDTRVSGWTVIVITLLTYKTMFPSDNSCTFNCACESWKFYQYKEWIIWSEKKDIDGIPSRLNYFNTPMFSYLSWNWVNIDIIFYRVNNIVAAILSIISNNSNSTPKFNFDFFFLHRTIETIKPLCVYQFLGYLNRVETSINNMCSLYRRVYSIRELLSPSTQKSLQSRDNCPWQGSCLPLWVYRHSQHGVGLLKFVNFILCLLHPLFVLLSPLLVQLSKFS